MILVLIIRDFGILPCSKTQNPDVFLKKDTFHYKKVVI